MRGSFQTKAETSERIMCEQIVGDWSWAARLGQYGKPNHNPRMNKNDWITDFCCSRAKKVMALYATTNNKCKVLIVYLNRNSKTRTQKFIQVYLGWTYHPIFLMLRHVKSEFSILKFFFDFGHKLRKAFQCLGIGARIATFQECEEMWKKLEHFSFGIIEWNLVSSQLRGKRNV